VTDTNIKQDTARPKEDRIFLSFLSSQNLPDKTAQLLFWSISLIGLMLDLWTKSLIFKRFRIGESYSIIDGFFQLTAVLNAGAAFGLANGKRLFLISASIIASVLVIGFFYFGKIKHRLAQIALGLFMAGVWGNLYDRIFNNGYVRDFIDITIWPGTHWPAFNLADSMLCIAVGLSIITLIYIPKKHS